ncbi:hypothetical protein HOLleu_13346 [Holothuria leucospilota]|uniref:PDZ domain-containing protein n=1 Tax=Holothuria leucospilota TaxID=206669 RepID=A0A9Q1CCR5_HOLLE|nr:hypothetical protein HOLleu_13346 [Holothuria leucospilota]
MADSENNSSPLRAAYSQKGTHLDLKAKLKKAEVADGVITQTVKWLAGWKNTTALVFDEIEEGGPLHQCGIRNGDELTSVNHAKVDCSHDVNHIASVILDCSPSVMLGIKRRRVVGSVPVVVLFQLSDAARWVIYVYTYVLRPQPPVPAFTPVIFVPQHEQSLAIDATINNEITMSRFDPLYQRRNIRGSGMFLKVFGVTEDVYHIKSSQTSMFLEVTTLPDGTLVPIMSSDPTPISLQS